MSILRRLISRTAQLTARTLTITPAALAVAVSVTPVAATQTADKSMTVFVTASESAPQGKATEADRQQAATAKSRTEHAEGSRDQPQGPVRKQAGQMACRCP